MLNKRPNPRGETRRKLARARRIAAGERAYERGQPPQPLNGEIDAYTGVWPTSFSKGLPHDPDHGLVDPEAFRLFVAGINDANAPGEVFRFDCPLGPVAAITDHGAYRPASYVENSAMAQAFYYRTVADKAKVRNFESPRAGHVYDLQGPDAAALAISSFPKLGGAEFDAELAELFAMAYLRDVPITEFETGGTDVRVDEALAALNTLPWFATTPVGLTPEQDRRRRARHEDPALDGLLPTALTRQTLFRGSGPGAKDGPYVSQFLLIGNKSKGSDPAPALAARTSFNTPQVAVQQVTGNLVASAPQQIADGYILWGVQQINQRLSVHAPGRNYLTEWSAWLDVQNGADWRGKDDYWENGKARFARTPRDLATYVHFDALYQAYLNAYLLLGGFSARFDVGLPSGQNHPTRGSFATFGPPHFQTLLTEVASRALKAVRRQKFNWQLRARPEYCAAMLSLAASTDGAANKPLNAAHDAAKASHDALAAARVYGFAFPAGTLPDGLVADPDAGVHPAGPATLNLLPMAFPEGSPMHPSYGAGHATVAGACVTILKTILQTYCDPRDPDQRNPLKSGYIAPDFTDPQWWQHKLKLDQIGVDLDAACMPLNGATGPLQHVYHPPAEGAAEDKLVEAPEWTAGSLTLIGELNKLAANIAIARNIAGVHYYIDYYASLRLGERVAVGILEEQLLTYPEPVAMRFESFDGDRIVFGGNGDGETITRHAFDKTHAPIDYDVWWKRHFVD